MPAEPHTDVRAEIARLRTAIDHEATSATRTLTELPPEHGFARGETPEHRDLNRQLSALEEHVSRAESRSEDQLLLRAELATLLSFATTLRVDAARWRSALGDHLRELERQAAAAREQQDTVAAEREALVRQRDALRSQIDHAANRMAQATGGECRRTIPVVTLGEHVSVCSISVRSPRRGFRPGRSWLVTLNSSRDEVLVRRGYG